MKVYILQGSHKKNGNTWQFTRPFVDALQALGAEVREGWLCDYDIKPCLGCKSCQNVTGELGCAQKDDFETLFGEIQASDILVLAAPIYCGFAPGPVKTFMDRLIYAPVKAYGRQKAPSMLAGKFCAIITTSGFSPEKMGIYFERCVMILAHQTGMNYLGRTGGTDPGEGRVFMNEKKALRASAFAAELLEKAAAG